MAKAASKANRSSGGSPPPDHILVGHIGAAHGIAGAVRVKSFTATPESLGDYGLLVSTDGRTFRVRKLRPAGNVLVVDFDGVTDRNAAEALNGTDLYVPRARLPEAATDEYYHADLIGLAAVTADGVTLGRVNGVPNYGAGDLLEIMTVAKGAVLVPFTRTCVPEIDVKAGRLIVNPPPGLLD